MNDNIIKTLFFFIFWQTIILIKKHLRKLKMKLQIETISMFHVVNPV